MAATTFTGPIQSGTQRDASVNVGQVVLSQSEAISQSTTAAATSIIIPANSQILKISVAVTTAWDNSSTLSVGTSATSNELVVLLVVATANTVTTSDEIAIVDADLFMTVGTSDITIWHDSTATTADAGRGIITVEYVQRASALAAIA